MLHLVVGSRRNHDSRFIESRDCKRSNRRCPYYLGKKHTSGHSIQSNKTYRLLSTCRRKRFFRRPSAALDKFSYIRFQGVQACNWVISARIRHECNLSSTPNQRGNLARCQVRLSILLNTQLGI